jgi:hypothetical protein
LDKIIPKNNDEGRAIYGNLENNINTLYWPVENSIPKNSYRSSIYGSAFIVIFRNDFIQS